VVDFIPLKEEDINADRAFLKGEILEAPAPGPEIPQNPADMPQ